MATREKLEEAFAFAATKLGVAALNDHQKKAVEAIVGGKDAFVCLPTGNGVRKESLFPKCSVREGLFSVALDSTYCRQSPGPRC